jgi:transposase InsO family protein
MRVLGALEHAPGDTLHAQYKAVSEMIFKDDDGHPRQFTWRTIQTWWYYYRKHGITENPVRTDKGAMRKMAPEDLLEAIQKVLPSFRNKSANIQAVYRACIEQGHLQRPQIAPNTFRRAVNKYDLLKDDTAESPKRRRAFAKAHANDLWQVDTLHGPYLRFNRHDKKATQVYLLCFIDDASRVIPHGQFYTADDTENLIHCLQLALYKRGVPKAIYADNGSNYAAKEFAQICLRLGTILLHTPVRDGAAKGKIERFFRTVRDQFLIRDLSAISNLDELNDHFTRWVEDTYHMREHGTIGMKPIDRFGLDLHLTRYLQNSEFNQELFYLEATRKVRTDNTFSFQTIRYEAPRDLRNSTITIRYSRFQDHSAPIVYQDGQRLGTAAPVDFIANDRKPDLSF